jgi:hypothetical protein
MVVWNCKSSNSVEQTKEKGFFFAKIVAFSGLCFQIWLEMINFAI